MILSLNRLSSFPNMRRLSSKRSFWVPLYLNMVLCHSFHDWSIETSSALRMEFRHLTEKANIRRVGFLRHGNTLPSESGVDFERKLSVKGRKQARQAGSSFGLELLPFHSDMILSPAPRTTETAQLFLNASGASNGVSLCPSPVLYDGTMQPEGSAIFKKIGYAPLSAYVDNQDENDRDEMRRLLHLYAVNTLNAMTDMLRSNPTPSSVDKGSTLWMVGHAIYLPSAVLGLASLIGCDDESKELALSTVTQEAEGYLVSLDTKKVSYLSRPPEVADA